MNEAAPQLPRIRVVSPSQSCGAHAALAREIADRLNRDEQRRRDQAAEQAFGRFVARIGLGP